MMVGLNPKDTQVQQVVDTTMRMADKDGKISFVEFAKAVGNTDIPKIKKMVVEV